MKPVAVLFVKSFGMYQPKDIAGFPERRAKAFIDAGVAVPYTEPPKAKPAKSANDKSE